jgi:hypothetical protein
MRKGFLIYEEILRKYIVIYEEAVTHIDFATNPFWISLYVRKILLYFFISVGRKTANNVPKPAMEQGKRSVAKKTKLGSSSSPC